MAIYHLSAKIISRGDGRSIVAAAAYRSGQQLTEDSSGLTFDYTRKRGIAHTEILAPEGAPSWVQDRSALWNAVERAEKRKDAQFAREIEIGLPVELDPDAQLTLVRDFTRQQFVSQGMVADIAIHRDDPENPHAHILLTQRRLKDNGFGPKERSWNDRTQLLAWRVGWEEITNQHLAQAGLAIRIDHRSLQAQGLDLEPGRKIGIGRDRQSAPNLPSGIAERIAEQREIARENGERILADPHVALKALTHYQATFTRHDLAKFLHTRTEGAEQFRAAYLKVSTSPEVVLLGRDDRDRERYTTREMLQMEADMLQRAKRLSEEPTFPRQGHGVAGSHRAAGLAQSTLSAEQQTAFEELIAGGDLKALIGVAGSGKSRLLETARLAWEAEGYTVKGAALSGIAAENLTVSSGIPARTLASYEFAWNAGRDPLTSRDILVIDEAGMVGTRQLGRMLEAAETAGAKVVLVGDPEQLQAIEAGAPFRAVLGTTGAAEINEVRRQSYDWQREATRQLSTGATVEALSTYEAQGSVVQVSTRAAARAALLQRWAQDAQQSPGESRLILAYTRDDVRQLNEQARAIRDERRELGHTETVETERGTRTFSVGERLYFLRNDKSLGVKNGTLGTIEGFRGGILQVRLDGPEQRRVAVDTHLYRDLDYGYASTVHKSQGSTVDRTYILATGHYDRHTAYVALSRHRESATLFYAAEDFGPRGEHPSALTAEARERFFDVLSRARPKELAHDFLDREPPSVDSQPTPPLESIDAAQQRAAERWREKHAADIDLHKPLVPRRSNTLFSELEPTQHRRPPGLEDELDL